jgi:hypothetical protein
VRRCCSMQPEAAKYLFDAQRAAALIAHFW